MASTFNAVCIYCHFIFTRVAQVNGFINVHAFLLAVFVLFLLASNCLHNVFMLAFLLVAAFEVLSALKSWCASNKMSPFSGSFLLLLHLSSMPLSARMRFLLTERLVYGLVEQSTVNPCYDEITLCENIA